MIRQPQIYSPPLPNIQVEDDSWRRTGDFSRLANYLWLPLLLLLFVAFSFATACFFYADLIKITLLLFALFAMGAHIWLSMKGGSIERKAPLFTFLGGTILSYGIAVLGCVYFLEPYGFIFGLHVTVTFVLLLLTVLGTLLGSLVADLLWPPQKLQRCFSLGGGNVSPLTLLVFGFIWVSMMTENYVAGGFSARWETGNSLDPSSSLYVVSALINITLPFFMLLGASCSKCFLSVGNLIRISILAFCAIVFGMTGGREFAIRYGMYFLVGVLYSSTPLKYFKWLLITVFLGSLVFLYVVGAARTMQNFGESSASDRLSMLAETLSAGSEKDDSGEGAAFLLLTRIAEPSGQIVIDHVTDTQDYVGLMNLDRLIYLYVPKFVMPDKPSMDDGFERLVERHGFEYNPFSSAPITLMADSYERGGYIATFFISLFISVFLVLYARSFWLIPEPVLRAIFMVHFTVSCLRLYSFSLLGILTLLLYYLPKDFLFIFLIYFSVKIIPVRRNIL